MIRRRANALKSERVIEFGHDADVGRIYGRVLTSMMKVNYQV